MKKNFCLKKKRKKEEIQWFSEFQMAWTQFILWKQDQNAHETHEGPTGTFPNRPEQIQANL